MCFYIDFPHQQKLCFRLFDKMKHTRANKEVQKEFALEVCKTYNLCAHQ